ncbi:hypothetical protein NLM31_21900 [Bradyrhizobium sp. CCGUVB4N]|uniref:hypothetical protein n=1 Tax=Bradyrhizobium sp. CCGUVB4N TaxID=2949631 RepID=UPI0020B24D22|nr:hypothetical protein [Bradyrhizobium sp. CCGUVB4N]MCP3383025.1 hypothetical protein [Bradyrhizobium sp. CCGUVB4N]
MVSSNSVLSHRARRAIASGSPVLLASGFVIAGFAATNIKAGLSPTNVLVWGVLILAILLLLFQMRAEYRKRTYDPTLLVKFTDEFHDTETQAIRCKAAKFLKTGKGNRASKGSPDLNSLFDFFDQVGFFLQGDQITAEAAHFGFHHWIRGYWSVAHDYVAAAQKDTPSLWEFVGVVFDMTDQVEREKCNSASKYLGLLDDEEIRKFLDEEIEATCGAENNKG